MRFICFIRNYVLYWCSVFLSFSDRHPKSNKVLEWFLGWHLLMLQRIALSWLKIVLMRHESDLTSFKTLKNSRSTFLEFLKNNLNNPVHFKWCFRLFTNLKSTQEKSWDCSQCLVQNASRSSKKLQACLCIFNIKEFRFNLVEKLRKPW